MAHPFGGRDSSLLALLKFVIPTGAARLCSSALPYGASGRVAEESWRNLPVAQSFLLALSLEAIVLFGFSFLPLRLCIIFSLIFAVLCELCVPSSVTSVLKIPVYLFLFPYLCEPLRSQRLCVRFFLRSSLLPKL